jgi:hypothetical protein
VDLNVTGVVDFRRFSIDFGLLSGSRSKTRTIDRKVSTQSSAASTAAAKKENPV